MSNTVIRKEKPAGSGTGVVPSNNTAGLVDDLERLFMEQMKPHDGSPRGRVDDSLMAELARIVGPTEPRGASTPHPQTMAQPQPAARPAMPQAHDPFDLGASDPHKSADVDPLKAFEEELKRFDSMHRAKTAPLPEPEPAPVVGAPSHDLPPPQFRTQGDFDAAPHGVPSSLPPLPPLPSVDELRGFQPRPPVAPAPTQAQALPEPDVLYPVDPEPVLEPDYPQLAEAAPPRNRRVMVMLGSAAAIALAGVVGAVAFKGGPGRSGDAPVIAAKTQPMKEKPADPGGIEVPGQDRQVLARKVDEPKSGASVVNKEEQPVDLNQTPKRDVARVVLPSPTQQGGSASPVSPPPAIMMPPASGQPAPSGDGASSAGGFEAKRVKSVKVGNDPVAAPTAPPSPSVPSMATGSAPRPSGVAPVIPATPPAAAAPPPTVAAPKVDRPAAAAPPKSEARPAIARPTQTPTTTPGSVRPTRPPVAEAGGDGAPISLRPPSTPQVAARAAAPAAAPSAGGSGGFAVQLAAPGSEAEARTVVQRLKQKHSETLGSYTPVVRSAQVGDKTVYRVRVTGLSRESANSLCSDLKADGGSCFVAGN